MQLNTLQDKKLIAEAVEKAVRKSRSVSLKDVTKVGRSYPIRPDVPGIWVSGPDAEGKYVVAISIAVIGLIKIPDVVKGMRVKVWDELVSRNLAERVRSVDVTVEDLVRAA